MRACFGAYNLERQSLWDNLRSGSQCEDCPHGFCPHQINPRCEEDKCTSDNAGIVDAVFTRSPVGPGDNVRLFCKAHNRYQAELDFGVDLVRRRIAERRASTGQTGPAGREGKPGAASR